MDDFEEVLVPELCQMAVATDALSAQLWIKVTTLPTILFRLSRLLMAEDLRQLISKETGLGLLTLPKGKIVINSFLIKH
jgi:endoribonuclease Dicer